MWYQNMVCSFVLPQSTRVTDGQTERQNYDPQDRASIAAARDKKWPDVYTGASL